MTLLAWISICWGRSVDWGSVAEWASGIGTVGALLLGLNILRRDHANSEKSQIDQVGWWYGPQRTRWGWAIANYSTLPVHISIEPADDAGTIFQQGLDLGPGSAVQLSPDGHIIAPGETGVFFDGEDTTIKGGSQGMIKWMVVMDNAGRKWEHKFGTGWVTASKQALKAVTPNKG